MKTLYLLFSIISFSIAAYGQTEPPLPSPCDNTGNSQRNNMTITGNTTFTFNNLADFETSEALDNITVNVKSSHRYKLYIAGVMTGLTASSTNTPIPINTFTIASTNRGSAPASITLSNSYLEVAQYDGSTSGLNHTLTITRKALKDFVQAPGKHTLTLHVRFCQY